MLLRPGRVASDVRALGAGNTESGFGLRLLEGHSAPRLPSRRASAERRCPMVPQGWRDAIAHASRLWNAGRRITEEPDGERPGTLRAVAQNRHPQRRPPRLAYSVRPRLPYLGLGIDIADPAASGYEPGQRECPIQSIEEGVKPCLRLRQHH